MVRIIDLSHIICYDKSMIKEFKKDRTCTYSLRYRIVWSTKKALPILKEEAAECVKTVIKRQTEKHGFNLLEVTVINENCVICLMEIPPSFSIATTVKMLKGMTGRILKENFPHLNEQPVWNHHYLAETVGSPADEKTLEDFLQRQAVRY